jgi:hypothetical protein
VPVVPRVLPPVETPAEKTLGPEIVTVADWAFLDSERVMLLPPAKMIWLLTVPVAPEVFPRFWTPARKVVAPGLTPPEMVMELPSCESVMLAPPPR